MKIINQTNYLTTDLRRILSRCAAETMEVEKRRRVMITVVNARQKRGASGCATIGGRHAVIRITTDIPRPSCVAAVAVHEFRHLNGMTHAEMPARYNAEVAALKYAWADALGIRLKAVKPKPTQITKIENQLIHARRKTMQAASRAKRATTLLKKWHVKVRYYEKRMAACTQAACTQETTT